MQYHLSYADLIARWRELFPARSAFRDLDFARTAENSGRTAGSPLFFWSPNRRRPRISAENEMSTADQLPEKQQKQREVPCVGLHWAVSPPSTTSPAPVIRPASSEGRKAMPWRCHWACRAGRSGGQTRRVAAPPRHRWYRARAPG